MLYFTLVRAKLEYASVAWNALTCTDTSKLERVQQNLLALCYNRFCSQIYKSYENALEYLNFYTLCTRRHHLDALFLVNVYSGYKFCPFLLKTVGICVPSQNYRDSPLFTVCASNKKLSLHWMCISCKYCVQRCLPI
jgi:hypothetical protein